MIKAFVCRGRFAQWMIGRGWTGVTIPLPFLVIVLFWCLPGAHPGWKAARHEWVHVQQAQRWGFLGFWARYLWGMRRGYRRNPLEIEAYDREQA